MDTTADDAARSIPACAGEPLNRILRAISTGVYPRVCGGTGASRYAGTAPGGLSPRVRGNLNLRHAFIVECRSIPACAGEPVKRLRVASVIEVYPRVCGGTVHSHGSHSNGKGLSPRVRGNRQCRLAARRRLRSIPACAGEPGSGDVSDASGRVYPRVCGGTLIEQLAEGHKMGLSPRVRGNQLEHHHTQARARSIPACAGEPNAAM